MITLARLRFGKSSNLIAEPMPWGARSQSFLWGRRDGMEEGTADIAAPCARCSERVTLPIGEFGKRLVASRCSQARIVKFVSAHDASGRPERAVAKHPRLAIAEVKLALGKARRMAE